MLHTNFVLFIISSHLFLQLQENDEHAILVVYGFLLSFLGNRKKGRMLNVELLTLSTYHRHILKIGKMVKTCSHCRN